MHATMELYVCENGIHKALLSPPLSAGNLAVSINFPK